MPAAAEQQVAPVAAPAAPAAGDVAIPQVPTMGAQGVRPAPPNTIPPPLQPFSQRPDSAMSKLKERLRGKTGQPEKKGDQPPKAEPPKAAEAPEKPPQEQKKPETPPAAEDPEEEDLMESKVGEEEKSKEPPQGEKKEEAAPSTEEKKGKVNPWKLLEEQKAARAALEKEVADVRKLVPNVEQRKAEMAEVESLKKRNEELEKHIQFVDYQASSEFKEKYEMPYKNQWKTSMNELKGVVVETDTGEREIEAQDLVDLVNMPKTRARQLANDMFGDFANDVMNERDKIRASWDAQQKALEEAKQKGVSKAMEMQKQGREGFEKLNGEVHEIYTRAVDAISKDSKANQFIVQKDGDSKHNELLTRGMEMVDEAFRMNPMDPSLTAKQRETIVKKHAAVRFRAAGYGPLKYAYSKLEAQFKEVQAKLAEYEGTVPNRGGSEPTAAPIASGGSKLAQMQARLRARAK